MLVLSFYEEYTYIMYRKTLVITFVYIQAFQQQHIAKLFEMYKAANQGSQGLILIIIRTIGEKHPKNLADFLPKLCDSKVFKPDSMNLRSSIIAGIGGVNKVILVCSVVS